MNKESLEQPFSPDQVKEMQGGGKILLYVEGHTVITHLNEGIGNDGWSFTIVKPSDSW